MKEFFLNLAAGALAQAGESELEKVLQKLHDNHPDQYKAAIFGGLALVNGLKPLTDSSKNKIDDAFINALYGSLRDSAAANGLVIE